MSDHQLATLASTESKGSGRIVASVAIALTLTITIVSNTALAASPETENSLLTIDDLGFSSVMNDEQFVSSYSVESASSALTNGAGLQISSTMEVETDRFSDINSGLDARLNTGLGSDGFRLDANSDDTRNFNIRRFSTSIKSKAGQLTVGNDWSNFQDFLGSGRSQNSIGYNKNDLTSEQVRWSTDTGFSVSLENDIELAGGGKLYPEDASSQSLVLSWRNKNDASDGRYSVSAMGQRLGSKSVNKQEEPLGWGLKLAGGWQFGDLFAALSVTLGNGIDRLILGNRIDRNAGSAASLTSADSQSFNINPSLNYRLGDNSNLHFAINRFESAEQNAAYGVDTLDTIHLGYSWNPWPSTKFGIEFVGKDVEGSSDLSDSNTVNFAASKRF